MPLAAVVRQEARVAACPPPRRCTGTSHARARACSHIPHLAQTPTPPPVSRPSPAPRAAPGHAGEKVLARAGETAATAPDGGSGVVGIGSGLSGPIACRLMAAPSGSPGGRSRQGMRRRRRASRRRRPCKPRELPTAGSGSDAVVGRWRKGRWPHGGVCSCHSRRERRGRWEIHLAVDVTIRMRCSTRILILNHDRSLAAQFA